MSRSLAIRVARLSSVVLLVAGAGSAQVGSPLFGPLMTDVPHLAPAARPATQLALEEAPPAAAGRALTILAEGASPRTEVRSNDLSLEGNVGYVISGDRTSLELKAERVANNRSSGVSGSLRLTLWATTTPPVFGNGFSGYRLGYYAFTSTLNAGFYFGNVDRFVGFTSPPNGTYYLTMCLDEYDGSNPSSNDGFVYHDFHTFTNQVTFGTSSVCTPNSATLCLLNNRFRVTLTVSDPRVSGTGAANATPQGDWGFFDVPAATGSSDRPVIFVKLIDGRPVNQKYWVFYGGLTDLQYTFIVTDTFTGASKSYTKATGTYDGRADTSAFAGN